MTPYLQAINGKFAGKKYELTKPINRIGRNRECEIHLDLDSVSRSHAKIVVDGDIIYVEDTKSKNKTLVNGAEIGAKTFLEDNDRVKISEVLFVLRLPSDPASGKNMVSAVQDDGGSKVLSTVNADRELESSVNPDVKLRAILEINRAVANVLDIDVLLPTLLESTLKVFPQADRALVILRNEAGELIPRASQHRAGAQETVRFSRTIVESSMRDKQGVLVADAGSDQSFKNLDSVADMQMRSVMCAPLLTREKEAMGVVQLDTASRSRKFRDEDLQLLVSVAGQAAVAIESARLHADIVQKEQMLYAGYVQREWLENELTLAREVQASFLPKSTPELPDYHFWSYYEAAVQVGGDFFDFVSLPGGKVAVLVADVSGKAIAAALFMAKAVADTRVALLSHPDEPCVALRRINKAIYDSGLIGRFISMAICVLDPAHNRMEIVNAGHMSPVIRRSATGKLEEPARPPMSGLLLGVAEDSVYDSVTAPLEPGDCVVLYSDGINEAMNPERKPKQFGAARLFGQIKLGDPSPKRLGENILADIRNHVADCKQSDDMTLVIFTRAMKT